MGKTNAKSPEDGDMSWATGNGALEPDGFGLTNWQYAPLSREGRLSLWTLTSRGFAPNFPTVVPFWGTQDF